MVEIEHHEASEEGACRLFLLERRTGVILDKLNVLSLLCSDGGHGSQCKEEEGCLWRARVVGGECHDRSV